MFPNKKSEDENSSSQGAYHALYHLCSRETMPALLPLNARNTPEATPFRFAAEAVEVNTGPSARKVLQPMDFPLLERDQSVRLSSSSPYIVTMIIQTAQIVNDFAAACAIFYPNISPCRYASGISPTMTLSHTNTCVRTVTSCVCEGITTLTKAVTSI